MTRYLFATAFALLLVAPASAAPPTDVADLFPPSTLAYLELHNPAELGPQLAALVKGTPVEDSIPFIHDRKDKAKSLNELHAKQQLAELAVFVSPEVLVEFRKLGGIAVALVGFNDRGEPELAVAVLTGNSTAAAVAARMFITTGGSLRKVAEVSKVPIFQHRQPGIDYDPNTGQPKLAEEKVTEGPHERTYAYTPGLFVVGTSKAAIAPIIKRFLAEEKETLRTVDGFKAAATEYRKPGFFFYVNAPETLAKINAAGRARGEPINSDLLSWLRIITNQKAVKSVAGLAHFRDGGVSVTVSAKLDPAQKSPLADFFAGPPVKVEALHHARKPASFAATVTLPEKDRAAALLNLLDAVTKSYGELGRLPSDVMKDVETKHKFFVRDGALAKVRAVTVIVPTKQDLPKGAKSMPMLVLHLEDAAAGTAWDEFLPKLVGEIAGEKPPQPSSETVGGVKVHSLPATGLPWQSPVHFARKETILVIGQDRKLVSTALTPSESDSVIGGKSLSLPSGDPALVGTLNVSEMLGMIDLPAITGSNSLTGPGQAAPPEEVVKGVEKARAEFLAAFGQLPPAAVTVRRVGDSLNLEFFQPKVQNGGLTPVINAGVTWFEKLTDMRSYNPNGHYSFPR